MSTTSIRVAPMKKVATLGKRKKSIDADDVKKIDKKDEFDPNQFYVSLTSHAEQFGVEPIRIRKEPDVRGPIIGTNRHHKYRNAIGAHGGSYCIYRGLAVASGAIVKNAKPDLSETTPAAKIGPHPSWADPEKIVTIDPFGACVVEAFPEHYQKGYDIRPTIAVTKAHMDFPEIHEAILKNSSQLVITKAAIDPVWYLPGVAKRFNTTEANLRQQIFQETNGMYPELVTRNDLKVFLPPIGGTESNGSVLLCAISLTIYIFGSVEAISDPTKKLAVGIIVYFRKEGRALGEVTKYLVYNLRKRQEGDVRFQALMPDALHWLGITKIDKFVSMSDMKYDAIVKSGIEIVERIPIPEELVPKDAQVEITAKVFAGYNGGSVYKVDKEKLKQVKGRDDKEYEDAE
ncbi:GTP cyclohydrolase II [Phytophthora cactorum]|nr:GTP cyclohydrolase II [Phytophthora cactorum]